MLRRVRNSQLRMLRACAFAYKRSYVDCDPGLPSLPLQRGRDVHAAILGVVEAVIKGEPINVYEIAYKHLRGGNTEYAAALKVLTAFQERLGVDFDIDPKKVLHAEEQFEIELELTDGTRVIYFGTPDLVTSAGKKRIRIDDWKSHWKAESQEEFEADPQLKRYSLHLLDKYPAAEEFELFKRFVRYENNYRSMVITREHLTQVRYDLIAEIEEEERRRRKGDFPATGGSWCALCEHHNTCPIIAKYRAQGPDDLTIGSDERAQQLAGEAIALEAAAKAIQDRLKPYLSLHPLGYVPVAEGTYGYAPVEQRDASPEVVTEILKEHGIEAGPDLMRVDLDALDRFLKRVPAGVANDVRKRAIIRSQTSRCQFRRGNPRSPAAAGSTAAESVFA